MLVEKIDGQISDLLDELKEEKDDAKRKAKAENISSLVNSRSTIVREDDVRFNNGEVNDINRMKVEIEAQKVKVEKAKVAAGVTGDIIDAVKACGFCWIAYNSDKVACAVRNIFNVAQGWLKSRRKY